MCARISVIIPCYNYGVFLKDTLLNVIKQSFDNWECIVVDDGSVDNTKEIALEFCLKDDRFKYIYRENGGIAAARNTGLGISTGELISFLDADDFLAVNKFQLHVDLLCRHPEIDIVYGNARYFLSEDPQKLYLDIFLKNRKWMPEVTGQGLDLLPILLDRNIMPVNAAVFRRSLFDKVGEINIKLRGGVEDWEFWVRCALNNSYFYYEPSEDAMVYVRIHKASVSKDNSKMRQAELYFRTEMEDRLKSNHWGFSEKINAAILINRYRMSELNIRHLSFLKGWFQNLRLIFLGFRRRFVLIGGIKATVKRILRRY